MFKLFEKQIKEEYRNEILGECVKMTYRTLNSSILSSFAGIILIYILVREQSDPSTLFLWAVASSIILLARLATGYWFTSVELKPRNQLFWKRLFVFGTACSGLMWGLSVLILLEEMKSAEQYILVMVLAGYVVASSATLYPLMSSFIAYAGFVCVPIALRMSDSGNPQIEVMTVIVFILIFYTTTAAIKRKEELIRNLTLKLDHDQLVARLRLERDATKDLNEKLSNEINQRKEVQEALQESQDDLIQSREDAVNANNAKSDFLASMSHELRTPLNAIIGYSDIMQKRTFGKIGNPRYEQYPAYIFEAGSHLLNLVNNMLDIAKIESRNFEIEEGVVLGKDIIRNSIKLVSKQADDKYIEIKTDISENHPAFRGDEFRLKQVLVNFLTNGVKFTNPKGKISVGSFYDASGDIVFYVDDTGIGMKEEDLKAALEPFKQVSSDLDTSEPNEGTGLGLAICKKLVEAHGGEIRLRSTKGIGTTIAFNIPKERIIYSLWQESKAQQKN